MANKNVKEQKWKKYAFMLFVLAVLLLYYYFNFGANSRYLSFLSKLLG